MRVAHLLRKLDPSEWSGTEMAIQRLFDGLRDNGVDPVVFCPKLDRGDVADPIAQSGFEVQRFRAFVPVWGLSAQRRRQLVSVGGNLMSFDLIHTLWRERDLAVMHAHALGRIGGIALTIAKQRRVPFVVTIHGGVLDLPDRIKQSFNAPVDHGWEWGKLFGVLFQSHRLFCDADAILTCNATEAALLQKQLPAKRIVVQPHGVPLDIYGKDERAGALAAFPQIQGRQVILCLGRIDPVKNQGWLLEHAPEIFRRFPQAFLVLAGPCTDEPYGEQIGRQIQRLGLGKRVLLTGGLPPNDPRVVGLLQSAAVLVLPSLSETFGLVILEAWAAGAPVISARASGPSALVEQGRNGWLFDLSDPAGFFQALGRTLNDPGEAREMALRGREVTQRYSMTALAAKLKGLYEELIEERRCTT
ncbi:MAG TPA: glycosyltransferase family 4 protein [Verrucomicrobiae bacterium]|nr:glycosyltransferase family 4 protein [Verrucomicrobiae bacterium]